MASKKLGETTGLFIVWLFFTSYFVFLNLYGSGSSGGTLPQTLTILLVLNLLTAMARSYGVILAFLVVFLVVWERPRSLKKLLSSLGLRKKGSVKSVFWSIALFPLFIFIALIGMTIGLFTSLTAASMSSNAQFPAWYLWYMVIYSFFPVAVVEEAWARGYMLDRLMPKSSFQPR